MFTSRNACTFQTQFVCPNFLQEKFVPRCNNGTFIYIIWKMRREKREFSEELRKISYKFTERISRCLYLLTLYLFLGRCFSSCHELETKKNRTSDLRICAPMLYHWATVSEVYYEVHMTRVLPTARISNINSVMFVDRNSRDGKFIFIV